MKKEKLQFSKPLKKKLSPPWKVKLQSLLERKQHIMAKTTWNHKLCSLMEKLEQDSIKLSSNSVITCKEEEKEVGFDYIVTVENDKDVYVYKFGGKWSQIDHYQNIVRILPKGENRNGR